MTPIFSIAHLGSEVDMYSIPDYFTHHLFSQQDTTTTVSEEEVAEGETKTEITDMREMGRTGEVGETETTTGIARTSITAPTLVAAAARGMDRQGA